VKGRWTPLETKAIRGSAAWGPGGVGNWERACGLDQSKLGEGEVRGMD